VNNTPDLSPLAIILVEETVRAALAEDLGEAGDITSQSTIPAGTRTRVVMRAREPGCIAGLEAARTALVVSSALMLVAFGLGLAGAFIFSRTITKPLARAADVYGDRLAIVHGPVRQNWRDTWNCSLTVTALAMSTVPSERCGV